MTIDKWQAEKDSISSVQDVREQIEAAQQELLKAEREANLEDAARLRHGVIPELQAQLAERESRTDTGDGFLREVVTAEDIAEVVARWTRIPVSRLLEGEVEKLVHMEERLHERMIGQDEAVAAVAAAMRRSRAGLADPDRPIGRVAVCGGAGDSLLGAVARAGVDAYLTADLRHHPADEHTRASGVALVDVAHWASEQPWCDQAAALLAAQFGDSLRVRTSSIRTDPWNLHAQRETHA